MRCISTVQRVFYTQIVRNDAKLSSEVERNHGKIFEGFKDVNVEELNGKIETLTGDVARL